MRFGYSETCLAHDTGLRHPENPDRLRAIREGLRRKHGVAYVDADPAPVSLIETVHDEGYVDEIARFCRDGGGKWDPDTVAVPDTWDAALASAGLAMWAAEAAMNGAVGRDTPFALGRPPGHHAVVDDAMGFCFINNVAVAAQHVLDVDAERVMIIDWDVHHGNGTQDIFYDRGDVYYVSIHEKGLYPGTGAVEETGDGDGAGRTLNVPLPAGAGDGAFLTAFRDLIAPAAGAFDPDLVLVSAGFDAHRYDPISRMRVSTDGYGALTEAVRDIASDVDAWIAFVLEGGYGLDTLADGVTMVHEVFDGYSPPPVEADVREKERDVIDAVRATHGL